jgi:hypothetical protein
MDFFGRCEFGSLIGAAVGLAMLGVAASPASAQESLDASKLDQSGSLQYSKPKGKKKPAAAQPTAQAPAKGGKPGGDRQFGELEGWSPGKTPAAPGKKEEPAESRTGKPPVSMSPSGQPSVGLTF